jgi:hypothetical protein
VWVWNGFALPYPPPIEAVPLDQSGYDELRLYYPSYRIAIGNAAIVRATSIPAGWPYPS